MRKTTPLFVLFFLTLSLMFCGRKGPILAPFKKNPYPASKLTVKQTGQEIVLNWKNPISFDDGSPLSEKRMVEIWIFSEYKPSSGVFQPPNQNDFEERASLLTTFGIVSGDAKKENGVNESKEGNDSRDINNPINPNDLPDSLPNEFAYRIEKKSVFGKVFAFSLRVKDGKKESVFSEPVEFIPGIVSLPPSNIKAVVFEDKIEIVWDAPLINLDKSTPAFFKGYFIYRSDQGEKAVRRSSKILTKNIYEEKSFRFGDQYKYFVRTSFLSTGSQIESGDSEVVEVNPEDIFPPKKPVGLTLIAGEDIVSLRWNSNKELDLAGYIIWRSSGEKDKFIRLNQDAILKSTFNDPRVKKNRVYFYAISAVDIQGNESAKSKPVSGRT